MRQAVAGLCKQVNGHKVEVVGRLVIRHRDTNASRSSAKTRHTFDYKVDLPARLAQAVLPMFVRVVNEVDCETRTPEEWARRIKRHIRAGNLRTWVASIAWWDYAHNKAGDDLLSLCEPLPRFYGGDAEALCSALRGLGFPDPEERVRQVMGATKRKVNAALAKLKPVKTRIK